MKKIMHGNFTLPTYENFSNWLGKNKKNININKYKYILYTFCKALFNIDLWIWRKELFCILCVILKWVLEWNFPTRASFLMSGIFSKHQSVLTFRVLVQWSVYNILNFHNTYIPTLYPFTLLLHSFLQKKKKRKKKAIQKYYLIC